MLNYEKINNVYFILYKNTDEIVKEFLKNEKKQNLFFDVVLCEEIDKIKYLFEDIEVVNVIPAIKIILIYNILIKNNKDFLVLNKNNWELKNNLELNDIRKYYVTKEQMENFIFILEEMGKGNIEILKINLKDKEKEDFFLKNE